MNDGIRPFRIQVPDALLDDLHQRLERTRWPDAELVHDHSQGVPLAWLQQVCAYWRHGYDWRAREARLNAFDQFVTEVDGLDLHFMHLRSPHPDALPLILTHGWPGSVVEFHKVIGPLTDPTAHGGQAADAFHVICPSLPGFAFSGKPRAPGWGVERIAAAWATLMQRLGYRRYLAQGGDWGSSVTTALGIADGAHCAGIHVTLTAGIRPVPTDQPSPAEQRTLERIAAHRRSGTGYAVQQATRPQTLAYGLTDSPAGQAAWILEKFWAWTDWDGHLETLLTRDELLDNVMLYWVSASAASSARLYWESYGKHRLAYPLTVPAGVAVFPKEITPPVRSWLEGKFTDIRHWTEMPRGGHFGAFEQPALFVEDLRAFARLLR